MKYYVEVAGNITYWYKDAKRTILHREDDPAVTKVDGYREWWLNDKLHREDGPAYIDADGTQEWYLNGKRHREDGPACIYADGTQEWWLDGIYYTEEQFHAKTNPAKELTVADIEKLLGHKVKIVK